MVTKMPAFYERVQIWNTLRESSFVLKADWDVHSITSLILSISASDFKTMTTPLMCFIFQLVCTRQADHSGGCRP